MKLNRTTIGAGGALALVALTLTFWYWPRGETAAVAVAEAAVKVDDSELPAVGITHVKATRIAPQVSYPGTVVSRNDSRLAADFEGRVEWVAEVGTVVKQGEVVARLDSQMAAMQLDSDKANVARLGAVLQFDRAHATRMQELLERKVMSKSAADQAVSTRDSNEAALKQAQAALKRSQYQLEHAEIRAPFDGRVVARLINAGEYANAGKDVV
ncbi:MAG: efflux RND transporter periplasmic adaptor subunit, partial [Alphaproteobacteria bacterium]|nr:efflux RND transporter periplasmic adaptor subunit [Alphaproteobacteria bacterium]